MTAPRTVLTSCLQPIDRMGLEVLIAKGKADPKAIKPLKRKTVPNPVTLDVNAA